MDLSLILGTTSSVASQKRAIWDFSSLLLATVHVRVTAPRESTTYANSRLVRKMKN